MLVLTPEQAVPLVRELAPSLAHAPPSLPGPEEVAPSASLSDADFQACHGHLPGWAEALHAHSERSVLLTGIRWGRHSVSWLFSAHAQGWLTQAVPPPDLALPLTQEVHRLRSDIEHLRALGHVDADAAVLALGRRAGKPGRALTLPCMGLKRELPWQWLAGPQPLFSPFHVPADGLYGILSDGEQIDAALQAGLRCVQLRHKSRAGLEPHLQRSIEAARAAGAQLFVNDHWQAAWPWIVASQQQAAPLPRPGIHLGQEDLLALSPPEQVRLRQMAPHLVLGLSSHSVWELARALGCGASLIACGPLQATTTKDMPWRPQGRHNLCWWVRHSPVPVVGIGGLLEADDLRRHAGTGAAALCVVRGLGVSGADMAQRLPVLQMAVAVTVTARAPAPRGEGEGDQPMLPHPVL